MTQQVLYLLALCAAFWMVPDSQGDGASTRIAVERAVAEFIRPQFLTRRIGLQSLVREFATPHLPTSDTPQPRAQGHMVALAQLAGGRLTTAVAPKVCDDEASVNCVDTLLRIGVPSVIGDTARVWIYTIAASTKGSEETDDELLVIRSGGKWRVVSRIQSTHSLYEPYNPFVKP